MSSMDSKPSTASSRDPAKRRSFLVRLAAIITGGVVSLFPFAAGWGVITSPLRRARGSANNNGSAAANLVRICPLDALPADGVPRQFAVIADVSDAWTHEPARRIGAVFLIRTRTDPSSVTAFTTTCPHLGCAVEYDQKKGEFKCPCHESGFAKDGERLFGPSRRGLDSLTVKLQDQDGSKEICVDFERFQSGIAERKPIG
jgi:quinol---cytochrome c reductase iron-sulfur subunit, bacillus type